MVVAIIGLLAAIAIPNFVKARETSRTNACISNLRQIDGAKQQWALENKAPVGDTPDDADLFGAGKYISKKPECPAGGTYTVGDLATPPECDVAGHVLPNI
ncbi:MAG TPA: prepilin-type cleavage/methylation domain-containing protein [Verrucomicrobiae bacterium]